MEGDKNKRGRNLPRPCAHVCRDTAKNERIKFHGVSKREKQRNIPRKAWKSKVQIRKQVVLVKRLLCGYSWKECKANSRVHTKPAERRPNKRPNDAQRDEGPVYG